MDSSQSTEHIKNDQVQYIYDAVLQKTSNQIIDKYNSGDYGFLGQEAMYLANVMFEKYKIQFYTIMKLTYQKTQNPFGQLEYLDIASINTLIRACYETYLVFYYIFMPSNLFDSAKALEGKTDIERCRDKLEFKLLLYKREGYKQSKFGLSMVPKQKVEAEKMLNQVETALNKNKIYNSLSSDERQQLLKEWKPSWNKIAELTELSTWNSKNMYNILSQYGHNSYTSLLSLNHHYLNLKDFDKDALNMQLFEITSLLINDYYRLYHLNDSKLTKDEVNLLSEFMHYAKSNPNDVN